MVVTIEGVSMFGQRANVHLLTAPSAAGPSIRQLWRGVASLFGTSATRDPVRLGRVFWDTLAIAVAQLG
jgi:hypothetical protein